MPGIFIDCLACYLTYFLSLSLSFIWLPQGQLLATGNCATSLSLFSGKVYNQLFSYFLQSINGILRKKINLPKFCMYMYVLLLLKSKIYS